LSGKPPFQLFIFTRGEGEGEGGKKGRKKGREREAGRQGERAGVSRCVTDARSLRQSLLFSSSFPKGRRGRGEEGSREEGEERGREGAGVSRCVMGARSLRQSPPMVLFLTRYIPSGRRCYKLFVFTGEGGRQEGMREGAEGLTLRDGREVVEAVTLHGTVPYPIHSFREKVL